MNMYENMYEEDASEDSEDEHIWNPRVVSFVKYYWTGKKVGEVLAHEGWSLGYTAWIHEMKKNFFESKYPDFEPEYRDFRAIKDGQNAFTIYLNKVAKDRFPVATLSPTLEDGIRWRWNPKP
jgi:hypothetical protein